MSVTSVAARLPLSSFPCYNNPPIIHASGKTRAPDSRPSAARGASPSPAPSASASRLFVCCVVPFSLGVITLLITQKWEISVRTARREGGGPTQTPQDGRRRREPHFFTRADLGKKENPAEKPRRPRNAHFVFLGRVAWPAAVTRPAQGGTGLFYLADAPVPARSRRARRGFTQRPYYGMCCC